MGNAFSKYQAYNFARLLMKPFEDWEAFKSGFINADGDIIKKPIPSDKMDTLENLVRKLKIILLKYLPSKKFMSFLISVYLLKAESVNMLPNEKACLEELNKNITNKELELLYNNIDCYNNFKGV